MPSEEEYWRRRRDALAQQLVDDEAELNRRLAELYEQEAAWLDREIASYYQRYGEDNVIEYRRLLVTLSDDDRRMLMEQMDEFAEQYPQYAHLLPVRASIYRLNELEGIQASIRVQQLRIGAIEQEELDAHFAQQATRAANLAAEEMGFGEAFYHVNDSVIRETVGAAWANGKHFSESIWDNRERLASYLNDDFAKMLARGVTYEEMARSLRDRFEHVSRRDSMRLIYTEGTFLLNEAQAKVHESDFEHYRLSCVNDGRACKVCRGLQAEQKERPARFDERAPGVNFPPLHPWCVLPSTRMVVPEMEAMTRSWYSGPVVEIGTADGTRLTVTLNHVVLTARGWVSAKNLVKGDKVVHYRGWGEAGAKSDPAHDDGVPTAEQLFATLAESGLVPAVSVPASAEHLKGDVIPDSEIDVVHIDRKLWDERDSALRQLVGDVPLVGTGVTGEVGLMGEGGLSLLLVGAGLASDGIMGGSRVAHVLRSGALAHHELVGLRLPSDYDARIKKAAANDGAAYAKPLGDGVLADARLVEADHLGGREDGPDATCADAEGIRDFVNALPEFVELGNVDSIVMSDFSGHVYDASSLSTLYICNGIITSNCRCSYEVAVDDWDAWIDDYVAKRGGDAVTRRQEAEGSGQGRNVGVPGMPRVRQFTGDLTPEEYAEFRRELQAVRSYEQIWLPRDEYAHVMSELNTHMSDEDRKHALVRKAIGSYYYTVVNYGFDSYKVIRRDPIE